MSNVNERGSSHDERSVPEAPVAPEAHDAPSPTVNSTSTSSDVTPPAAAIPSASISLSATPSTSTTSTLAPSSTSTTSLAASSSEVNTPQAAPSIAASTSTSTATPSKTINLRVLSPALELSGGLHLGAIAVDTTIGALRYKISEQAVIQASISALPDNQRLIYCGRALVNNADTLENIFGSAQLQQQSDFTIHLVLRQHVGATPNSSTPDSQSRSHTPLHPGGRRSSTANNAAAPQLPRPAVAGAPPFPNFARPAIPGMPLGQVPGFMIPPQLPGMHLHPHHRHPHAHPPSAPRSPIPPQSGHGTPAPGQDQPQVQGLQLPQLPQLPANATTRVINGPDGTRYTVRVNSSTITFPANAHHHHHHPNPAQLPQFAALQQQLQPNFNPFIQPQLAFAQQPHRATPPPANFDVNDAFDDPVTANDVQELARLTSDFARLMQAEPGISDQARQAAQALRGNTEAIASRLGERRSAPTMSPNQTTPSAQQQAANIQHFDATAATVYLLSSPAGPQALLFAPQGTYTGQSLQVAGIPTMSGLPTATVPQTAQFGAQQTMAVPGGGPVRQPTPANANPGLPDPPLNIVQPGQAVAQLPGAQLPGEQEVRELVRQFNQERQNPPGDVLAQWQPLLAQFWLLFRVMLFAYFFFPTDQGWYRPLAMAFVCLAFWLLNGDGPGRGVRDAVRSWWEGVVGIPARREAPQDGAQAAPPVLQPAQQQPEPELHWLRQTFRPIERALALFVASFWPGIGERTVAARRAEEERQRREEQEIITAANEEAARRESAENETHNASAATENGNNNDTSSMLAEAGSTAGEQEAASTTTRGTATGAQVGDAEALRERKTIPRAATVEEEKDDDATATQVTSSTSQIEQ